jgi:1,6-anhydro-N-acetylmuramate kinase
LAVVQAIGLMSGTSLDGVDVALIETDGERALGRPVTGPTRTVSVPCCWRRWMMARA